MANKPDVKISATVKDDRKTKYSLFAGYKSDKITGAFNLTAEKPWQDRAGIAFIEMTDGTRVNPADVFFNLYLNEEAPF